MNEREHFAAAIFANAQDGIIGLVRDFPLAARRNKDSINVEGQIVSLKLAIEPLLHVFLAARSQ